MILAIGTVLRMTRTVSNDDQPLEPQRTAQSIQPYAPSINR